MKRKIITYNPNLKELARQLRNKMTDGERNLWKKLQGRQMLGFDFHRQKPIYNYIVDFFCNELMLAIEIDGLSHDDDDRYENDIKRQKELETIGVTFLRFEEKEVIRDIKKVLFTIEGWILKHTPESK